jgi:hypothetical protein
MIVSEIYNRLNLPSILHIYSNNNFFLQYENQLFRDAYVENEEEIQNYIETNIPLPPVIVTNDFICQNLIFNSQLTEKQILAAKPILEKALNLLNKDEVYYVKFLFPLLDLNREYQIGERFQYNDKIYEAKQVALGNNFLKENSNSFEEIKYSKDFLEEWNSNKIYAQGDRVNYGEHTYESLIDNNNWSPQDFPMSWKLI